MQEHHIAYIVQHDFTIKPSDYVSLILIFIIYLPHAATSSAITVVSLHMLGTQQNLYFSMIFLFETIL